VDQETIWEAQKEFYTVFTDVAAGGRLAFDDRGHLYMSVGAEGGSTFNGIQDLSTPYGKVHRIYDDGSIPAENPFYGQEDIIASIYTYGHRSPQGLEFNYFNGELYGTEHGPRGGDEINHLIPGRNYGWPLTSLCMDYDGTRIEYGRELGITFELADIEQAVVDLTPSLAVSGFVIMDSGQFPQWQGHLLAGSLKARSLFRFVIDKNGLIHRENCLKVLREFVILRSVIEMMSSCF
jgi:glucose/arabinose dehydrogenase